MPNWVYLLLILCSTTELQTYFIVEFIFVCQDLCVLLSISLSPKI